MRQREKGPLFADISLWPLHNNHRRSHNYSRFPYFPFFGQYLEANYNMPAWDKFHVEREFGPKTYYSSLYRSPFVNRKVNGWVKA